MPVFRTPSGKIELYSEQAEREGYDPLPGYEPAAESAEADPALGREFPINLLSPAAHHFLNSTFSNLALPAKEREGAAHLGPPGGCTGARRFRRRRAAGLEPARRSAAASRIERERETGGGLVSVIMVAPRQSGRQREHAHF